MISECTGCKTKLQVPDDRIKPEGSKFRCPKCNAVTLCITESVGKNRLLGLLMLVPFVYYAYPGFLAFSGNGKTGAPLTGPAAA
jgi:predicted Zn finger-like uncharacterized protein